MIYLIAIVAFIFIFATRKINQITFSKERLSTVSYGYISIEPDSNNTIFSIQQNMIES